MAENNNDDIKWLYGKLSAKGYDIGSEDDFATSLNNDEDRKWYYDKATSIGLDMGSMDEFESIYAPKRQEVNELAEDMVQQPVQQVAQDEVSQLPKVGKSGNMATLMGPQADSGDTPAVSSPILTDAKGNVLFNNPMKYVGEVARNEYSINPARQSTFQDHVNRAVDNLAANTYAKEHATREQVENLSAEIDRMMQDEQRKTDDRSLWDKLTERPDYENMGNGRIGLSINGSDDLQALYTAKRSLSDARKMIEAADNEQGGTFVGGLARGFGEKFLDVRTWDMGITDMGDAKILNDALTAADNDEELTAAQRALLDAKAVEMATQAYFSSYLGRGYKAGSVTAESIPFMLEMVANPLSAVGKTAQSMLFRYALKRFGRQAVVNSGRLMRLAGGATRVIGDAVGSAGMAATSGMPGVMADTYDRMNGEVQFDEGNNMSYAGHEGGKDAATAFKEAFLARAIENHSEMLGEYFAPFLGVVGKGMEKVGLGRVSGFLNDVSSTEFARAMNDFERRAKWNGSIGEFAEEIAGGIENSLLVGDQTIDTDKNTGLFNTDNLIDTFLGVSVMSGAISTLNTIGYRTPKYEARKNMERRYSEAETIIGDKVTWEAMASAIQNGTDEERKKALGDILSDPDMTMEQKSAVLKYASAVQRYNGVIQMGTKRQQENAGTEQADLETSYDNGYTLEQRQEMNDAKNMMEVKRDELGVLFGINDSELLEKMLGGISEDPVEVMRTLQSRYGLDDAQTQQVLDYLNAKATYDGMLDRVRDDVDTETDAEERRIRSNMYRGGNSIVGATMKKDDRKVYILDGKVLMTDDGALVDTSKSDGTIIIKDAETGKMEMVSPRDILGIDTPLNADDLIADRRAEIEEQYATEAADKIDGVLPFNIGDAYVILDQNGQPVQVVVSQDQTDNGQPVPQGSVKVDVNGQTTIMPMEDVQNGADAYNRQRLQVHEQQKAEQNEAIAAAESEAETRADETDAEPAVEQPQQLPMPMTTEGEPDITKASPERTQQYFYNETGFSREVADQFVGNNLNEAKKTLEKLRKKQPKPGTSVAKYQQEMAEWRAQQTEAQRKVDYWTAVADAQKAVVAEERAARKEKDRLLHEQAVADERERKADEAAKAEEQARIGTHAVAPAVYEKWDAAPKIDGVADEMTLANGEVVRGHYVLTESGAATPSHDPSNGFAKSEGFPIDENGQSVNDRDYERDADMPYTAETFGKFNQQEMKSQSKTEQAVKLGKTVDDATMGRIMQHMNGYDTLGEFYADDAATHEAMRELAAAGAVSEAQMAEMFDGDSLSKQGRELLENLLIGKAFESNPDAVRMISANPSMRQAVVTALSEIVNNKRLGSEYSLEKELADAVALVDAARKAGVKVGERASDFARQTVLFPESDEQATAADYANLTTMMLADVLNDSRTTQLRKVLAVYNSNAQDSANGQTDVFTGGVRSRDEILEQVKQILNYRTEEQQKTVADAAGERKAESVQQDGSNGGSNGFINNERGGQTDTSLSEKRESDLQEKQEIVRFSDEVDENGRQFVLNSDGKIEFGVIGDDSGLTPAPILLSEGLITNPETNDGYGLVHIEARHGEQIRKAGYPSVLSFIEKVAKNWEVIKEGKDRKGNQTYMLQLTDKHNNTLMVELSGDGSYWNINTAGIFKKSYGAKNREVYRRHTTAEQSAETVVESQGTEQSSTQEPSSMNSTKSQYVNAQQISSTNKDSEQVSETQEKAQETTQENESDLTNPALEERVTVTENETEEEGKYGTIHKREILVDGKHSVEQVDEPDKNGMYTGSYFMFDNKRFGDLQEVVGYIDAQKPVEEDAINALEDEQEDEIQKMDEAIADYVAEHYPTQATISGKTNSEEGLREREAMKSDATYQQMLSERKKRDEEYNEKIEELRKRKNEKRAVSTRQRTEGIFDLAERIANERQKKRIEERVKKLGNGKLQFKVYGNTQDIEDWNLRQRVESAMRRGNTVYGWTNAKDGVTTVYLLASSFNGMRGEIELTKTILHEMVQHYGVKELLGDEQFGNTMRTVWNDRMSDAEKDKYAEYAWSNNYNSAEREAMFPGRGDVLWSELSDEERKALMDNGTLQADAADEFLASMIEIEGVQEQPWFKKLADAVRKALRKLGFDVRISDSEIADLWNRSQRMIDADVENGGRNYVIFNEEDAKILDHVRFRFIGEKGAANADVVDASNRLDNLETAREMEADKKDAKTIKMATGWELGADGKWRYEVPDGKLTENFEDAKTLDEAWDDEDLFKEYPQLRDVKLDYDLVGTAAGSYNPTSNTISINLAAYNNASAKAEILKGKDGEQAAEKLKSLYDPRNIFVHEIQHVIQRIEGFASGSSPAEFIDESGNVYHDLYEATKGEIFANGGVDNTPEAVFDALNKPHSKYDSIMRYYSSQLDEVANKYGYDNIFDLVNDIDKFKTAQEQYRNTAGEVESRNVQMRMPLTPEQRRKSLAAETEDVAREDQIFLYDALVNSGSEYQYEVDDSEMVNRLNAIDRIEPTSIDKIKSMDKAEAENVISHLAPGNNKYDGREVVWVKNTVGKILRHKGFDSSTIIPVLKEVYDNSIPLFSEPEIKKEGHREHPNFVGYHHYLGRIIKDGKVYNVRLTLQEINTRKKDLIPNQLHSTFISDVEITSADTRVNSGISPTTANASTAIDTKLQSFFERARDASKNIERQSESKFIPSESNETAKNNRFRIRDAEPPKKTGVGYKVFVLKDGKLYPPMVANPNGESTPIGVWLDADAAPIAGESKTGRPQVKAGGKGTQGGSGKLAYRPGWHLGVIPYAKQFNRLNPETGEKELFPSNFVWAEVEYAADNDYQKEAEAEGMQPSGKYSHALAGLKKLPKDGYYMYRTNPDPTTDPWIITGSMKVRILLTPTEVDNMVKEAGREPQKRQEGAVTDEQITALNNSRTFTPSPRREGESIFDMAERINDEYTRFRAWGFEPEYEGLSSREISDLQYEKAKEIVDALKMAGYEGFKIDRSITHFGVSTYIIGHGLKFRISDHGVTSIFRASEIAVGINANPEDIIETVKRHEDEVEEQKAESARYDAEIKAKWDSIKDDFNGMTFGTVERTYDGYDEFSRKHPDWKNILQTVNNGAYRYEYSVPTELDKMEYKRTRPSDSYIMRYKNGEFDGNPKYNKPYPEIQREADALKKKTLDDKWESIKGDYEGYKFKRIGNSYVDAVIRDYPEAKGIMMHKNGTIEFAYPSKAGKDKPSYEYIQNYGSSDNRFRTKKVGKDDLVDVVRGFRQEYDDAIKKRMYQVQEAIQDSMLGLKTLMDVMQRHSGLNDIEDWENPYMNENQLSSRNQAEQTEYRRKYYEPIVEAGRRLIDNGMELDAIGDYLMLKHGIERNREMAVRAALTDKDGNMDKAQLKAWNDRKNDVRNDASLAGWQDKQREMDRIAEDEFGVDLSGRDHSGLTSIMATDDVTEAVNGAYVEVQRMMDDYKADEIDGAVKEATRATLEKMRTSGLMSKATKDGIEQMYDFYVPLRGFDERTSEEVYSYLDSEGHAFSAPVKTAKGRSSKADSPLTYILSMADSGIMQGNRNLMKQQFLNFVQRRPSDLVSVNDMWVMFDPAVDEWKTAMPTIPADATPDDVDAIMQKFNGDMQAEVDNGNPNVKRLRDTSNSIPYRVVTNAEEHQHQVIVKRAGRPYVITINGNPRAALALNGRTNPNADYTGDFGWMKKTADYINRQLSAWYTTRNPNFVASNFIRDALYTNSMVWVKESPRYAAMYNKNFMEYNSVVMGELFHKFNHGKLDMSDYEEREFYNFMMNGGETGYSNLKEIKELKEQLMKDLSGGTLHATKKFFDRFEIVNRSVENGARFAAYMTSRQNGRSIQRSVMDAKEISVNFNKKGAGSTFAGKAGQTAVGDLAARSAALMRGLYVFFNAGVQGTTNILRAFKNNPKKAGAMSTAFFVLGLAAPLLGGGFGDDDDKLYADDDKKSGGYFDLNPFVRRSNIIIPGFGDFISLPLPIEFRTIYGMGELAASVFSGKERYTADELSLEMAKMFTQALPVDFLEGTGSGNWWSPLVPSSVAPLVEAGLNTDWTGKPIYRDTPYNKNRPEWTKAYSRTNSMLVSASRYMNELTGGDDVTKGKYDGWWNNPAILESIAQGYFGGATTTLNQLYNTGEMIFGDKEFDYRNIPILNRVMKSGSTQTRSAAVNREYYRNMDAVERLRDRVSGYKNIISDPNETDEKRDKYTRKLEELLDSDEWMRAEAFNSCARSIQKANKSLDDVGTDPTLSDEILYMKKEANLIMGGASKPDSE